MEAIANISKQNSKAIPRKAKLLFSLLSRIEKGKITVKHPNGETSSFSGSHKGAEVTLQIHDWNMISYMLAKGDIGMGESYQKGMWDCSNIDKLIEFGIDNQDAISKVSTGNVINVLYYRFRHWMNRNTKSGSRKNIHAHYDIGNAFYDKWLDTTMTYSSALYNDVKNESLSQAQVNKYNRILDQLNIKDGTKIIEIGCGWGGLINEAIKRGAHVTGVTLSQEQYDFCCQKFDGNSNVEVKLCDYRDLTGKYDYVVSIEMFEALGEEYWNTYFEKVNSLLNKNGRAVIQTITINDQDFNSYRKETDFIQEMIFPGGMLPCPKAFRNQSQKANFKVHDEFSFGLSYAETLSKWDEKYQQVKEELSSMGYDTKFHRLWHFYLKYCEGGFRSGKINVYHYVLDKKEEV